MVPLKHPTQFSVVYVTIYMYYNNGNYQQTVPTGDKTRSSADADNRRDAFSGQSRSTNMVPFHM